MDNNVWKYDSAGLGDWHFRKKLGGPYRNAPIMSDRLQGVGNRSLGTSSGSWTWSASFDGKSAATASHRLNSGAP